MLKEILSWLKAIVIALLIAFLIRQFLFTPSVVVGESMYPTLRDGDRIIISKVTNIERYDPIALIAPTSVGLPVGDENSEHYVKRIVGVPGDVIEIKDGILFVNDEQIDEPYLSEQVSIPQDATAKELGVVPEDMFFVLGDNRDNSYDSRAFGFIDEDTIIGEVVFRIWPLADIGLLD